MSIHDQLSREPPEKVVVLFVIESLLLTKKMIYSQTKKQQQSPMSTVQLKKLEKSKFVCGYHNRIRWPPSLQNN